MAAVSVALLGRTSEFARVRRVQLPSPLDDDVESVADAREQDSQAVARLTSKLSCCGMPMSASSTMVPLASCASTMTPTMSLATTSWETSQMSLATASCETSRLHADGCSSLDTAALCHRAASFDCEHDNIAEQLTCLAEDDTDSESSLGEEQDAEQLSVRRLRTNSRVGMPVWPSSISPASHAMFSAILRLHTECSSFCAPSKSSDCEHTQTPKSKSVDCDFGDGLESDSDESEEQDNVQRSLFMPMRTDSCRGMPASQSTISPMMPASQSTISPMMQLQLFGLIGKTANPIDNAVSAADPTECAHRSFFDMTAPPPSPVSPGMSPAWVAALPVLSPPAIPSAMLARRVVKSRWNQQQQAPAVSAQPKVHRTGEAETFRGGAPTTICFRNLPNDYSTQMVLELLDKNGYENSYDFVYVPHDFKRLPSRVNVGYFFVNFVNHNVAALALEKLSGFKQWHVLSNKVLSGSWATKTQGKSACIERCKYFTFMHKNIPNECKPMMFEDGVVVPLDHVEQAAQSSNRAPSRRNLP